MRVFQIPEGMPKSVWENKYARTKADGSKQSWGERVEEVVLGNTQLSKQFKGIEVDASEHGEFLRLMKSGVLPLSGRHLQQGDEGQGEKVGELLTNCSTAAFSFLKFWLLMKGSGVGRLYDEDVCLVDWSKMPTLILALSADHPDFHNSLRTLGVVTPEEAEDIPGAQFYQVADSAEGWAAVVQILESAAFQGNSVGVPFVFDFTPVRGEGVAIRGQQNRPASGPVPFMKALLNIAKIAKTKGRSRWEMALRIDHELSTCVLIGGIRRAARIAVKSWDDAGIFDFITIKKDGGLWSANNSVAVTEEFWQGVERIRNHSDVATDRDRLAHEVFERACKGAYFDNTGEPAFLNVDKLSTNLKGAECLTVDYLNKKVRDELEFNPRTNDLVNRTLHACVNHRTPYIVNPCGEVPLAIWGGYCVIGDVCLANVHRTHEAKRAAIHAGKALVRVNLMPFLYEGEVARTNRIGVSLTGIHEFAWEHFGLSWRDLVGDLEGNKNAQDFWDFLAEMRVGLGEALTEYTQLLGVEMPHTYLTIKPSGTVSKVLWCSEGAHLAPYTTYMRWVMFPTKDAALWDLKAKGYPVKDISSQYPDHYVVGFPTVTRVGNLMGFDATLAGDAKIEDQYTWLRRLEEYWLGTGEEGGQVSYTLKYNKDVVSYSDYVETLMNNQRHVRCCAFMPQVDLTAYVYQPEESISWSQYSDLMFEIENTNSGYYDSASLECAGGACPIEFDLAQ